MSIYWNIKKKSDKKYILIQHPLKIASNTLICGIKFCGGYGVAAEGSKEHFNLKKIPIFKKARELPLSFLKTAGFRLKDVQLVFGHDIYYHYLDAIGLDANGRPVKPIEKEIEQPFSDVRVAELIEENKEELDMLPDSKEEAVAMVNEIFADTPSPMIPELTTEDIIAVHKREGLCPYVKNDDTVCENKSNPRNDSGFCFGHARFNSEE